MKVLNTAHQLCEVVSGNGFVKGASSGNIFEKVTILVKFQGEIGSFLKFNSFLLVGFGVQHLPVVNSRYARL
jgi:hypothetical protein